MLIKGILNPNVLSLLARVRHRNTLVIADRGLPFWPQIETIDLSLVDNIPTVLQVFEAIKHNFVIGQIFMAEEFLTHNTADVQDNFKTAFGGIEQVFEPHIQFERRIQSVIGLIRTADTIQYSNLILESA